MSAEHEYPDPTSIGAVLIVDGQMLVVQESADEVMRLREQALVAIDGYEEGEKWAEAGMCWIALTAANGQAAFVDPEKIAAALSQRKGE